MSRAASAAFSRSATIQPTTIAAEDVEQDVEVEVGPRLRSEQPGDVPRPDLVGRRGEEFGFGVVRMAELIAPFSDRLFGGQEAVHGAFRAQVPAFVEQCGDDLARGAVEEARGGEHVQDALALGAIQCPGGRRAGLPGPGSGPLATVEGGSGQAQRPARRRHADLRVPATWRPSAVLPVVEVQSQQPGNFSLHVQNRVRGGQFLLPARHLRFELADLAT